jgi:hypothetical protein
MRKTLMVLVAVGVGAALVAAGCGGNDDDDTSATTATTGAAGDEPLSKEQFILSADQICARGDQEIEKAAGEVFQQGQQPSREEQEQFITDTVLPNVQQQIDGIRALPAPEGDEDQVTAILDAAQEAIDTGEADPAALTGQGADDPFAEANKLAEDYGLKSCGSS